MASSSKSPVDADRKRLARRIVRGLAKSYPDAHCALTYQGPFQLLVATILSAQCTDERVNLVTPKLFEKYPTAEKLAKARQASVEKLVHSTGFFRAKATNLRAMAQGLVKGHGGEVPQDLDALVALSGVGRKTANVVLGTAFGIPTGVVVDTHVKRISRLIGLTAGNNPDRIERDLTQILPKKEWIAFSHRMIHHGRKICIARRPNCPECPLLSSCRRVDLPPLTN